LSGSSDSPRLGFSFILLRAAFFSTQSPTNFQVATRSFVVDAALPINRRRFAKPRRRRFRVDFTRRRRLTARRGAHRLSCILSPS
jgi:hypothetical protein